MPGLCDYQTQVYTSGTTAILDAGDTSTWTMHDMKPQMSNTVVKSRMLSNFILYLWMTTGTRTDSMMEKVNFFFLLFAQQLITSVEEQMTACEGGRWQTYYDTGRVFEQTSSGFSFPSKPVHLYMQSIEKVYVYVEVKKESVRSINKVYRSMCVCCGLGHAAPATPLAVSITQKRIPANFLFGKVLLIETSVHMISRWWWEALGHGWVQHIQCWTL